MKSPNPELFVNVGRSGNRPIASLSRHRQRRHGYPEFLFLVNGVDDNKDGYVDNGWDGIDNEETGSSTRSPTPHRVPTVEWVGVETETWQGSLHPEREPQAQNLPYTITRRPVVSPGSPRDAAAIECGGRPDHVERPVF